MPTYEYQCDACDHNFDEFQAMKDEPLKKCPKCGKQKLRRVFGIGAAVIFKGSGFYQTDYRSESYKQAAKADQEKSAPAAKDDKSGTAAKDGTGGTAAKDASTDNGTAPAGKKGGKSSGKNAKSGT